MKFLAFFVLALALVAPITAVADLSGAYRGVAAAQGMRLQFAREGEIYQGLFSDRSGGSHVFEAEVLAEGAETLMEVDGRQLFLSFTADGPGVRMVSIPLDEAGEMIVRNAQALIFINEAIEMPPRPTRYIEPPTSPGGTIDPEAFIESYAFWPAEGVSYGYGMVRTRYRTLIRLHALVQTDIIWKMCQAQVAPAGLAEALRGQGVDCSDVLSTMGAALRNGEPFNRFKQDVLAQKKALTLAVRCSIDYRRNDPECMASGKRVAQAAVSMETVASVLARY